MKSKISHSLQGLLLFLAAASIFFLISFVSKETSWTDFPAWSNDAKKITECFSGDQECNLASTFLSLSKFPVGYLIFGLVETNLSANDGESLRAINSIGLSLPILGILISNAQKHEKLLITFLYICIIGFSPIAFVYVNSGALEILQGSLLGLYLTARFFKPESHYLKSKQAIRCFCLFACCLFKDTFVITFLSAEITYFTALHLFPKFKAMRLSSSKNLFLSTYELIWLAIGTLTSITYNQLRYQSLIPASYIKEAKLIPVSVSEYFHNYLAAIASPNGGLIAFYGIPASIIMLAFVIKKRASIPTASQQYNKLMCIYCAIITLISLAFTSKWWAAFGWVSWGNRLAIPWAMTVYMTAAINCYHTFKEMKKNNHFIQFSHWMSFSKAVTLLLMGCIFFAGLNYTFSSIGMDNKKISKRIEISETCIDFRDNYYYNRDSYSPQTLIYTLPSFKQCTADRFWHIVNK